MDLNCFINIREVFTPQQLVTLRNCWQPIMCRLLFTYFLLCTSYREHYVTGKKTLYRFLFEIFYLRSYQFLSRYRNAVCPSSATYFKNNFELTTSNIQFYILSMSICVSVCSQLWFTFPVYEVWGKFVNSKKKKKSTSVFYWSLRLVASGNRESCFQPASFRKRPRISILEHEIWDKCTHMEPYSNSEKSI